MFALNRSVSIQLKHLYGIISKQINNQNRGKGWISGSCCKKIRTKNEKGNSGN